MSPDPAAGDPGAGPGPERDDRTLAQSARVRELQRRMTMVFSSVFIVIGLVMIGVTAARGGGIGYVIGALFTALGGGRLKLALRKPPGQGNGA